MPILFAITRGLIFAIKYEIQSQSKSTIEQLDLATNSNYSSLVPS